MTEIKKTLQYQTQKKFKGCLWSTIIYPDDLEIAEITYEEHMKKWSHINFRIIKIETIKSVIK